MKNRLIILAAILFSFLLSSCSTEKKYEINGKVIDEKYLLWEFAAKLEEQEYRLQGFNLEQHMQPQDVSHEDHQQSTIDLDPNIETHDVPNHEHQP